ncbi:hypothetical protein [Reyranella sp.]|uniref:hypothetical protein n=1 Tax=Reyranella sp. TaxID=1929291 RepID=UPI00122C0C3F|nr:hypothetical protein [Reyranella sp.]TAJ89726.1 MAG: hypothetical protein EPO50_05005 [Reyranella sp.]
MSRFVEVSRELFSAYRAEMEKIGPRHRNVCRWLYDLGWGIDAAALDTYLAPERLGCVPIASSEETIH